MTETFSLAIRGDFGCNKNKAQIQSSPLTEFSLSSMATLGNKRKLAVVSRETPESTRNDRAQNTLDPESTQDYISQVSEEIEGRITKKLSQKFSRTESRILGASSNLDEFLLNPQVRTCSVAVPETSRNSSSENRGTTGDRPSDDPCPEVRFSSHHSGHLNSPEVEDYPHKDNWVSALYAFYFLVVSWWRRLFWISVAVNEFDASQNLFCLIINTGDRSWSNRPDTIKVSKIRTWLRSRFLQAWLSR